MEQTIKKYNKKGNSFVEDVNGYCIGFEWTDEHSLKRRVIYYSSSNDLELKTTTANYVYQLLDPIDKIWKIDKTLTSTATMTNFINSSTGVLEQNPYIMQKQEIEGQMVEIYVLKPGLIPEFQFLYNIQYQIFESVMKSIQARKFGATSFTNG
ncbi:MAG: hypothetical protein IT239_07155 [Bacteroidia bacterium]|nr:hypothetical protein [Bacteroidia bacterium]